MNNLKKKLFAATAMLVVSAVMLGSSTFAWYTLSTAPEIKAVQFNMSANENLEIALDNGYSATTAIDSYSNNTAAGGVQGSTTGNPYTWGNLIDLTYAFTTATDGAPQIANKLSLKPVKYVTTVNQPSGTAVGDLAYPQYGTDGRIDKMAKLKPIAKTALSTITGNDLKGGVEVYNQGDTDTNVYDAFSVTYWLRTNMSSASVSLSATGTKRAQSQEDASQTDQNDPNGVNGLGSYISAGEDLFDLLKYDKLVIRLDYPGESGTVSLYAKPVATSNVTADGGKYKYTLKLVQKNAQGEDTNDTPTIPLSEDTGLKIKTYVYLDGEKMTNADALLDDLEGIALNLQFVDSNINDAINVAAVSAGT